MKENKYRDFDLEITRLAKNRYQARVISSPAGEASVEFKRPFTALELENFVLRVGRTRTGTRRINSPEMQAAENFGRKLFDTVFQDGVRECYTSSLHQIDRGEIPGLRLRLRLVDAPELADLPWEYLFHSTLRRFINLSAQTPVIRYTDLPRPVQPLTVVAPLRLLVMISSPTDYARLDVGEEKRKIECALQNLTQRGLVAIEWMENATLSELQRRLRKEPVHIFHFIGHGGWDPTTEDGFLLFENNEERGWQVSANHLATLLRDHKSLALVVLNACEGGRASSTDPFSGVAGTLVHQGIPAVLAMQFEITDDAAIELAQVFYESLADGYSAEAALAEARKAIFASGNDIEWGTPVLYLRAPDGHLFDLQTQAELKPKIPAAVLPEPVEKRPAEAVIETPEIDQTPFEAAVVEKAPTTPQEPTLVEPTPSDQPQTRSEAKRSAQEQPKTTRADAEAKRSQVQQQAEKKVILEFLYNKGKGEYLLDNWQAAVDSLSQVVEQDPNYKDAASLLADARRKAQEPAAEPASEEVEAQPVKTNEAAGFPVITVQNADEVQSIRVLAGHTDAVRSIAFSPDGTLLASGSMDNHLVLWRLSDGTEQLKIKGHSERIWGVAFSPDGNLVATTSWDKTARLWQVSDLNMVHEFKEHTSSVYCVAFSPDGQLLATGTGAFEDKIRLWRVNDSAEIQTSMVHENAVNSVAFSPDGKLVVSASTDNSVRIWETETGKLVTHLKEHPKEVICAVFSPDGSQLATGSKDYTVKIWAAADGKVYFTLQGHKEQVNSVAFSPNGKLLASGSNDQTVKIWQVSNGKLLHTLTGHLKAVNSVAFSPDGTLLASGSGGYWSAGDSTVRLWGIRRD